MCVIDELLLPKNGTSHLKVRCRRIGGFTRQSVNSVNFRPDLIAQEHGVSYVTINSERGGVFCLEVNRESGVAMGSETQRVRTLCSRVVPLAD